MLPLPRKRPKTAAALRRRLNWWSPLFFAGIQITYLSDDFMHCRARLRNWFNTKNTHGSQFGGSLFALTDPIYPIMLGCLYCPTGDGRSVSGLPPEPRRPHQH